jgi:hypothetical protein
MSELVKCKHCTRMIKGRVPAGGDGSALFPYRHKNLSGRDCSGVYEPGEWVITKEA